MSIDALRDLSPYFRAIERLESTYCDNCSLQVDCPVWKVRLNGNEHPLEWIATELGGEIYINCTSYHYRDNQTITVEVVSELQDDI